MEAKDWILTGVAVYGALLSSYNLFVAQRARARMVQVALKRGLAAAGPEPEAVLFLEAANPRSRSVTLTGCGLLLPDGRKFVIPQPLVSVTFPHELKENSNCTVLYPLRDIVHGLQKEGYAGQMILRAVFTDALGKDWLSKPFKGVVKEWANEI